MVIISPRNSTSFLLSAKHKKKLDGSSIVTSMKFCRMPILQYYLGSTNTVHLVHYLVSLFYRNEMTIKLYQRISSPRIY